MIEDPRNLLVEHQYVKNSICGQLLTHGGISFKVYGENIPLAVLINIFGLKGMEELLEQGAINFLLWKPGVTYFLDDHPGVHPLQSMNLTSGVHSDPEESIASGLRFLSNPLPRRTRRDITRKVAKRYIIPPENLASQAVEFGHEGYNSNLFKELGLPKTKELTELNKIERQRLCDLATQCFILTLLSMYHYNSYNSFDLLKLNRSEFEILKNAKAVEHVVEEVFQFEKIPDFSKMISLGLLDIKDIPKLRATKGSEKFRLWIDKVSHLEERDDIIREYFDAVVGSKSFLETNTGKLTRTMVVTTLGATVGSLAGPIGIASGAVVGFAIDGAISLLDAYVLGNLMKGWNPKHYIDKEIKPLIEQKK